MVVALMPHPGLQKEPFHAWNARRSSLDPSRPGAVAKSRCSPSNNAKKTRTMRSANSYCVKSVALICRAPDRWNPDSFAERFQMPLRSWGRKKRVALEGRLSAGRVRPSGHGRGGCEAAEGAWKPEAAERRFILHTADARMDAGCNSRGTIGASSIATARSANKRDCHQ
jgi:hypothetical protein